MHRQHRHLLHIIIDLDNLRLHLHIPPEWFPPLRHRTSPIYIQISLSTLQYTPLPDTYTLYCSISSLNAIKIQITCLTNTNTLTKIIYSYLVYSQDMFTIQQSLPSVYYSILTSQVQLTNTNTGLLGIYTSTNTSTFHISIPTNTGYLSSYRYMCQCLYRGIQMEFDISNTTNKLLQLHLQCDVINGYYYLTVTIGRIVKINTLLLSVIAVNTHQLSLINNNIYVNMDRIYISSSSSSVYSSDVHNMNTYEYVYMLGMSQFVLDRSVGFGVGVDLSILGVLQLQTTSTTVSSNGVGFGFMWFAQLQCLSPLYPYLQITTRTCSMYRTPCTTQPQISPTPTTTSTVLQVQIAKKTHKMFSYLTKQYLQIMRYNGSAYTQYTRIYDPSMGSGIVKFYASTDYSRVALLTYGTGLYIYAWNGSQYYAEYSLKRDITLLSNYLDFSMGEDFRKCAIIQLVDTGARKWYMNVIAFNDTLQMYTATRTIMPDGINRVFWDNNTQNAYIFNDVALYTMKYQSSTNTFVQTLPYMSIQQIVATTQITSMSINSKMDTIAIQYSQFNLGINYPVYNIKILQYSLTGDTFVFHHRIPNDVYNGFSTQPHVIKISDDGLKMLIKPTKSTYSYIVIMGRSALTQQFVVKEVVKSTLGAGDGTQNYGLDGSSSFDFIISGDVNNTLSLYFCKSIISNPYFLYSIPKAVSLVVVNTTTTANTNTAAVVSDDTNVKELQQQLQASKKTNLLTMIFTIILSLVFLALLIYAIYLKKKANKNSMQQLPIFSTESDKQKSHGNSLQYSEIQRKKGKGKGIKKEKSVEGVNKDNGGTLAINQSLNSVQFAE